MSGGYFEYQDWRLDEIANRLRLAIARCRTGNKYYKYSNDFLNEMIDAHNKARELRATLHRIDWVLSADNGEDSYFEYLAEDLKEIEYDNPMKDDEWISGDEDFDE